MNARSSTDSEEVVTYTFLLSSLDFLHTRSATDTCSTSQQSLQVKYSKLSNYIHCIIDIIYMGGLIGREKELRKLNCIFNDPKLRLSQQPTDRNGWDRR